MEAYINRGRETETLKCDWLMVLHIRWHCCQLLSCDLILNKVKPSVRTLDLEILVYDKFLEVIFTKEDLIKL